MLDDLAAIFFLIKIFLFGKVVLLTASAIDIKDNYILELEKPIYAISSGAHIAISAKEITEAGNQGSDLSESFDKLEEAFPQGSIVVVLRGKNDKKVVLDHIGCAYTSDKEYLLMIVSSKEEGVPVLEKFHSLEISTKTPLTEATIKWANHSM